MSITDELRHEVANYPFRGNRDFALFEAIADRIDAEHDESMACDRVHKAEAENAKLRELVEDMLDCIEIRMAFGRPPTSEMYEEFARRADELGIEVD